MKSLLTRGVLLGALGVAIGCAETPSYVYTPEATNAQASGFPAERIAIPQEAPQGAVEVASYGVTDIHPGGSTIAALHVRMIVTNDGDATPWQLDTTQQLAEIPGEGTSRPIFINSDMQSLPMVTIGQHEKRVLDFYYPLPDTMTSDRTLPRFEMLWQVQTPSRVVASRTAFDRVTEPDTVAYGYGAAWPYTAGYGPYWWYDPFYPSVVFLHSHPFAIRERFGPVHVGHFGGHFHAGGAHVARAGGRR